MTEFIRPEFTSGTLLTFIGYHFQIFAAGRAKISLQTVTNKKKKEFYTARPKKDRAAYQRQKARSLAALPDHYAVVDRLLADVPDAKIFRLHEKGNNNATADNAHLLASLDQATLWLVMSGVVHRWQLNTMLVHVLLEGKGNRTGEASIFNEYMPTYEHDWEDAEFGLEDYKVGPRLIGGAPALSTLAAPPPPPVARLVQKASVRPTMDLHDWVPDDPNEDMCLFTDPTMDDDEDVPFAGALAKVPPAAVVTDYVPDDPSNDPIFFAEHPDDPPEAVFPEQQDSQSWPTAAIGRSTWYGTEDLRAQLLG